jgi:antitoxin (DNA-binding transcriptional repressor) of toxin-antitoxin stability system
MNADESRTATVNRIPITAARINLGAVVKRVRLNGEYFILEKDGIPIVGIMGADELEDYLELRDPKIRDHGAARHGPVCFCRSLHSKVRTALQETVRNSSGICRCRAKCSRPNSHG